MSVKSCCLGFVFILAVMLAVAFFAQETPEQSAVRRRVAMVDDIAQLTAELPHGSDSANSLIVVLGRDMATMRNLLRRPSLTARRRQQLDSLVRYSVGVADDLSDGERRTHQARVWVADALRSRVETLRDSLSADARDATTDTRSTTYRLARGAIRLATVFSTTLVKIAWPLALLGLAIYFFASPAGAARLEHAIDKFENIPTPWGALTSKVKRADDVVAAYRAKVKEQLDLLSAQQSLPAKLTKVCEALAREYPGSFRSTVYISDPVLSEHLYQLLEYWPLGSQSLRGRSFSVYFGIIGRAWRLDANQVECQVPTEKDKLIKEWGMTGAQAAAAGSGHQSFAVIVLHDAHGLQQSLLYLDAAPAYAFGRTPTDQAKFVSRAKELVEETGLGMAINGVQAALGSTVKLTFNS